MARKPDGDKSNGNEQNNRIPPLAPMPSSTPRVGPNLGPFNKPLRHDTMDDPETGSKTYRDSFAPPGADIAPSNPDGEHPAKKKTKSRRKKKGRSKAANAAAALILEKKPGPIVPKGTIAGHALVLVIAIMSFLAALTVAAVSIISDATRDWQSDISKGATIQIRQIEGTDIEREIAKAIAIARKTRGISSATVLSSSESNALLEPWLGLDITFDDLPVPRLIELTVNNPMTVDFDSLSKALQEEVPGAILDNHRFWVERLRSMAETAIFIGFTILLLVVLATILTVVFATRSAMSGNKETIEVLHFVGASNKFIAGEFQRKFFALGLQGAFAGGLAAMVTFVTLQLLLGVQEGSAAMDQMQALLGVIDLGYKAYIGTFALIILIAVFTAITTRLTVTNTLKKLS
ncbi:ABC transporter permease [uncultured Cohaesibacter sp.]|uniref:cell division protein FtsX n=1 Tax=uncultured Cohaesibacter sp. TaxID=1002546 RepID=UPI002930E3D5|nr:ABC transporter permease [uncultured Cohaesibacter sp.]